MTFDHPIKQRIDGTQKSYGVQIKYAEDKEMRYVVTIAYISSIDQDYHCKIERKQVFINGEQPNRLIDKLAEQSMDKIYPIDFKISPFSGIKEILNSDEVKERWNTSLKDLKREYRGDFADQYFEQINQTLTDQDTFFEALKNEMFYSLVFFKKESLYENSHIKKDISYSLPVNPYKGSSEFKGNQRVQFEDQKMIFHFKGKDENKSVLELKHIVNQDDFSLSVMKGAYKSPEKEMSFAITELKERSKKYVKKIDAPKAIPKELIKKKKSWFSDLFNRNKN